MDHRHLPTINTNIDLTGHAHPAPRPLTPEEPFEAVRDLVLKVPVDVVLRRLPSDDVSSACGPHMPRVRRSPLTPGPVQHLDIVSCWKGLLHSQMLELVTWEGVFRDSLASQLKHYLQQCFTKTLLDFHDPMNETLLVPRMLECLRPERPLTITIAMTSLIHHIIARLFGEDQENAHRKLAWSLSSGNLPSFVFNFVRTHDCIFYDSDRTRASFNISPSYSDGVLTIFAEAQWQIPKTTFAALPTRLSHGDTYRITPQFEDLGLAAAGHSGFSLHKTSTEYTVINSPLPLQWDSNWECFHAPIPSWPQHAQNYKIETTLCTKVTTLFHAGVRYERVSRHIIKLDICEAKELSPRPFHDSGSSAVFGRYNSTDDDMCIDPRLLGSSKQQSPTPTPPTHDAGVPSNTNTPHSKTRQQCLYGLSLPKNDQYHRRGPTLDQQSEAFSTAKGSSSKENYQAVPLHYGNHLRAWAYPSTNGRHALHTKRKASRQFPSHSDTHGRFALDKFEHLDLEVDTKRRKLHENDDSDVHVISLPPSPIDDDTLDAHLMNTLTGQMGDAQMGPTDPEPCWFEKLDDSRARTLPKSFTATLSDRKKQTTFPWRIAPDSIATSPTSSPVSPQKPLSQEEIQRNYREFEERRQRKAAEKAYYMATVPGFDGVVSPTDDDDKAFERVFLEGSEMGDWETDCDVDGLSEGVASVCVDAEL